MNRAAEFLRVYSEAAEHSRPYLWPHSDPLSDFAPIIEIPKDPPDVYFVEVAAFPPGPPGAYVTLSPPTSAVGRLGVHAVRLYVGSSDFRAWRDDWDWETPSPVLWRSWRRLVRRSRDGSEMVPRRPETEARR